MSAGRKRGPGMVATRFIVHLNGYRYNLEYAKVIYTYLSSISRLLRCLVCFRSCIRKSTDRLYSFTTLCDSATDIK